ncbi:hypothetical protein [Streptacidiphilus sp. MAP5-52]|uniref:hypothetical protein n=1 Tax=Streptacidiphilus sp. MAP5-52 TaxID=3156267 RepID=UPI003516CECC
MTVHGAVADELAATAIRLDHVQERIVALATALQDDLQRVIGGADVHEPSVNGVLQNTPAAIDLLCARRTELGRAMDALVGVYASLPPLTLDASPGSAAARHRSPRAVPSAQPGKSTVKGVVPTRTDASAARQSPRR